MSDKVSRAFGLLVLVCMTVGAARAGEDAWLRPLGPPPPAKPRRIGAGEGFAPLPLPVTPLRRSERKREPAPPKLVGKVVWGEVSNFTYESGHETRVADWNMCPGDVRNLLRTAGRALAAPYGAEAVRLAEFHGDPARTPVLFFSGGRTLKLTPHEIELVREYVLAGGMVVFDSIAGSPYFYEAAKAAVREAFPELALRTVPADHPVYHMLADVDTVAYPRNLDADRPRLEGVYVGCRIGALISPYGLGCGWDGHEVPLIREAVFYDVESANKIGVNLVAYAVGYGNVGRAEAKPELFGTLDEKRPTDEFVFAQIRHEGAWNVHPGGAAALLRRLRAGTSLRVSLRRVPVDPGEDDLSGFPFLYLTGLDTFQFSDADVAALRRFLDGAGTLLVNNGLGLSTFDGAVRRELKRVLPEAELAPVPVDHPVYSTVFPVRTVRYTPAVVKAHPDLQAPLLEGIALGGELRVIYSPFDLEAGWQGTEHPLCRGVAPESAMELGVNVVLYAVTH